MFNEEKVIYSMKPADVFKVGNIETIWCLVQYDGYSTKVKETEEYNNDI